MIIKTDVKEIGCGLDSAGFAYGPVVGSYKPANEPFGSIKGGEFINQLSGCQFMKKLPAPYS
jgi:hypothetical protein